MAAFADELEPEGWRVGRFHVEEPNPAKLLKAALPAVTTTYALRLDADTSVGEGLERAVAAVLARGRGPVLGQVRGREQPRTSVTKDAALEYRMAMLGRHYPTVAHVGRVLHRPHRRAAESFARHSLWTPGEDIETGSVAKALRMKVRHLDFVVTTDAPDTWPSLFRQRRLWWAGNFRQWSVNVDKNLAAPARDDQLLPSPGSGSSVYWKWWT